MKEKDVKIWATLIESETYLQLESTKRNKDLSYYLVKIHRGLIFRDEGQDSHFGNL